MVWYDPEQWALVRAAAVDPERLEATYERWLAMAEEAAVKFVAAGVLAKPVEVKARELIAWCGSNGRSLDAASRAEYVAGRLREESGGTVRQDGAGD